MTESEMTAMSQDATLVAALAGTAMPFARSAEDQVERWVRALRLHGRVGSAMQGLGIGEAPLRVEYKINGDPPAVTPAPSGDVTEQVVRRACEIGTARGADSADTADLLNALLEIYEPLLDRALEMRGSSRKELLARLSEVTESVESGS